MDPDAAKNNVSAWVIMDENRTNKSPGNPRFWAGTGVILCRIRWQFYGQAGQHWKDQLSPPNLKKWGQIYIDANKTEQDINRRDALWPNRESPAGRTSQQKLEATATNLDECPGAMFVWETRALADVQPLCAQSNQELGRHMYNALAGAVKRAMVKPATFKRRDMQWFEVVFKFV